MEFSKNLIEKALAGLKPNYCKMLLVDLAADVYTPVLVPDDEWATLKELKTYRISEYWSWFADGPLLHNDDKGRFISFLDSAAPGQHMVYRRLFGSEYRWVLMELKAGVAAGECVLYVRDINDIYVNEYAAVVERIGSTDSFTGLYNKLAWERDCKSYKGQIMGVVWADVNGLKFTNDTQGHKAGDELLLKFSALLSLAFGGCKCYHLSGDEFTVLSGNCGIRDFLAKAVAFHKALWTAMDMPMASVGYSVGPVDELGLVIEEAEKEMYDDKRIFYSKFPEYKRK